MTTRRKSRRGSVLLAVLWISAALAAIAFALANTVRGETERAATTSEGLRTHYLAVAGIQRAVAYILWGPGHRNPDGSPKYWEKGLPILGLRFPAGDVRVEIIPETAKLDVNKTPEPELFRLIVNAGAEPQRAEVIAKAIIDWRTPASAAEPTPFDREYLLRSPTFRGRHASLEEIEELLLVKGMTPELFHGGFARDPEGRLVRRAGLKDCLSVYGSTGAVDANFAAPPVLATIGLSPVVIQALVERRHAIPFRKNEEFAEFVQQWGGPGFHRLQLGGGEGKYFTLRSTAQLRLPDGRFSDLRRTVSALIFLQTDGKTPPITTLRWYDN